MHRRHLLSLAACAGLPGWARAASVVDRVLVLVELKGGNDGLNTVVPYADPAYAALRPTLALKPDVVLPLDEKVGLHPALAPLMPLWAQGELAVLQGLGYPSPNLSHFRSIEIWDSASASDEYLDDGWVARAMAAGLRDRAHFTTEGVALGSAGPGALRGARAVAIGNVDAFVAQSRLVRSVDGGGSPALAHVLRVESDVMKAADGLRTPPATPLATEFPAGAFGQAVRATCRIVAGQAGQGGVPVFHLSLGSFDTHQQQAGTHAGLLKQLAEGLVALRAGLVEAGAWDRTLVLTYSEFGRRARENQSRGTDHGTASSHFALGGAVKGGLIGTMPELERLDATQNLVHTSDFRQVYATIARQWWGVPPEKVIRGRFDPLPFLRA
ncbi:Twin-arginine translocation pathway signal sequence domain-containing protein [Piscinibacter gummiphilus]|uniref:Twin-arginine translocation pathway signal sequence domain-containing protein n=1 Tax=Piscinibacter gummiphilus TaxID=946333 RepID=A0A1W6LI54_9BURK|nr:DUF1501 domain-containing protein [Piscinibacter gummiphilus]ARN23906.1 Twin-arginine translocation pathway signal sequence domain-containing protein [Piscinibacter gummiphilus]ATU68587.1 DUF1501 domain-containing protein [Piscinibacter gummiphilus]